MYENSQLQQRRRATNNNANNGFGGTPHQRDSYVVRGSQTREDLNQVESFLAFFTSIVSDMYKDLGHKFPKENWTLIS